MAIVVVQCYRDVARMWDYVESHILLPVAEWRDPVTEVGIPENDPFG